MSCGKLIPTYTDRQRMYVYTRIHVDVIHQFHSKPPSINGRRAIYGNCVVFTLTMKKNKSKFLLEKRNEIFTKLCISILWDIFVVSFFLLLFKTIQHYHIIYNGLSPYFCYLRRKNRRWAHDHSRKSLLDSTFVKTTEIWFCLHHKCQ